MKFQEKVIYKLLKEKDLKEYDSINLESSGYFLKFNTNIVKHNEIPTLLTKCDVAVVVRK